MECSPITSHVKGYPFEVALPPGLPVSGAILSDHLKSLDWSARRAERICAIPAETTRQVLQRAALLIAIA